MAFPLTFEWKDKEPTGAVGWVVIDNIINSVAGGGIFMHSNATKEETAAIAKNMSRKFTVTDPQIGGAKAGVRFDHRDPRAKEVLRRFILAQEVLLRNYWVTAGDLNTDDSYIEKVIVEELHLSCCQAQLAKVVAEKTSQPDLSQNLSTIIPMPACKYFPLIEGAVGYGLAAAVEEGLQLIKKIDGSARVVIQGFGAVGSSLAYYLETKKIAKVIAISDKDGILFDSRGLPISRILDSRKENVETLKKTGAAPHLISDAAKNCLVNLNPAKLLEEGWGTIIQSNTFLSPEDAAVKLATFDADVFCPCAIRYIITPRVVENMSAKLFISGANNPYGLYNGREFSEDKDRQVLSLLEEKKIVVIPDWVANSGTAQLFHRSLSVKFNLGDDNAASEILEACAVPIRSYIMASLNMPLVKGNIYRLHQGSEHLAAQRLQHPVLLGNTGIVSIGHRSRYAYPPISVPLTPEEKVKLCLSLAHECVNEKELLELFKTKETYLAYDGFEPSGKIHAAQGLFKARIVNNMTKAGFTYILWIADWFAFLNHKYGSNLEAIQTVGKYFIEVWKACGMDMTRVKFLWASEEFSKHGDEYWAQVLDISTKFTVKRIMHCNTIMGRKDSEELSASQILYPCMQAADIKFLGVDVCQLGHDQRKVNMLAREYADKAKVTPPIILSHPMLPGLKKNQEKMSKSDPSSAIFMEDSVEDVEKKIKGAHCPPGDEIEIVKNEDGTETKRFASNPCLDYLKYMVFDGNTFTFAGSKGVMNYNNYKNFEEDYRAGLISPQDLKGFLTSALNKLLQPVRDHFIRDPYAAKLLAEVKELQTKYATTK
jgi:tyrosyl-tRNA synthetase